MRVWHKFSKVSANVLKSQCSSIFSIESYYIEDF
jgi:hypothetical protein